MKKIINLINSFFESDNVKYTKIEKGTILFAYVLIAFLALLIPYFIYKYIFI